MSERADDHPRERLQALLDGRLDAQEGEEVSRHLDSCRHCRGELAALRWARDRVAELGAVPAPAGLAARVRAALDAEDLRRDSRRGPPWWPVAAAAALLCVLLLVPLWIRGGRAAVREARADLAAVETGSVALEARHLPAPELESWFAARGLPFAARVFDLGGMAFELVGGRIDEMVGGPSALFVYRGPDGVLVVCQMFVGPIPPLAAGDETHRREDGVEFRTVVREGAVLVFWQEGEVACVMASEGLAPAELRALAFAKAIRI